MKRLKQKEPLTKEQKTIIEYEYVINHRYPEEIAKIHSISIQSIQNHLLNNIESLCASKNKSKEERIALIESTELDIVELSVQTALIAARKMRNYFLLCSDKEAVYALKQVPGLKELQYVYRVNSGKPTSITQSDITLDTTTPLIDSINSVEDELN